jgi:serine-threonine kinase receptor-associated protein
VPLTCHGHSRPITHLHFSSAVEDEQYYLISAAKGEQLSRFTFSTNESTDNNPQLRDGVTGDW